MNTTRRSLLTKIIGALCTLPLIGKLLAKPAPVMVTVLQHTCIPTRSICMIDLKENPDASLCRLSAAISEAVKEAVDQCHRDGARFKGVDVRWVNIRDTIVNPDGLVGYFRVIATREVNQAKEVVDARHVELKAMGLNIIG